MNAFNMTPVTSSHIAAVGFNPETGQGRVTFLNGATYTYGPCTAAEAEAIQTAESVGRAFNATWRGREYTREVE